MTALRAPASYGRAEAALGSALVGVDGVLAMAGRIELLSRALATVADGYAAADAAAAAGLRAVQLGIGRTLGTIAGRLLAPAVLAGSAAATVALVTGRRFGRPDGSPSDGGASLPGSG